MKRAGAFFLAMTFGLFVAGNASAGTITATYDLAGSTLTTSSLLGTDTDQITGTVTLQYGATSINAPISWAALVTPSAATTEIISPDVQTGPPPADGLWLNGVTTTNVTGSGAGGPITPAAATITLAGAPATVTGSLHCTGGYCGVAGFAASVTQTVFPPTSLTLHGTGGIVFPGGQAGLGNWTAGTFTATAAGGAATLTYAYVGQEIERIFVPEPGQLLLMGSGIATLVILGALRLRRSG